MYTKEAINELKRLRFENIIWVIFIILGVLNIFGDFNSEEYILTKEKIYKENSNNIFLITLVVTFFIYIYFLNRNYKAYIKATPEEKNLYIVKVLGSSFLIAGIICLIYFQLKDSNFIGSPAI